MQPFWFKARFLPVAAVAVLGLAACETPEPLAEYRPVVDPGRTDMARYEQDLAACRSIAIALEADYKRRQEEQAGDAMAGALVGALVGAAVGNAVAGNDAHEGHITTEFAIAGAAVGAAGAPDDYPHDLVKFGPRRLIDRCITERGHAVLADPGRS